MDTKIYENVCNITTRETFVLAELLKVERMDTYFFLFLGDVDWKTLDADIKFSIYCPKTWFSDFSFKFSSFTLSTLTDKSATRIIIQMGLDRYQMLEEGLQKQQKWGEEGKGGGGRDEGKNVNL